MVGLIIYKKKNSPWKDTTIELPFPSSIIRIRFSILNTRHLPIEIRTRKICVQGFKRLVVDPFPSCSVAFTCLKDESIIENGLESILLRSVSFICVAYNIYLTNGQYNCVCYTRQDSGEWK